MITNIANITAKEPTRHREPPDRNTYEGLWSGLVKLAKLYQLILQIFQFIGNLEWQEERVKWYAINKMQTVRNITQQMI